MSSTTSAPHRTIANIRTGLPSSAGLTSPHTPSRNIPSAYGSPSSVRAEEDLVIIELGSRFVRVGFAGDALPKAQLQLRPEQQRRVGDHRIWAVGYENDWTKRRTGKDWAEDYELWRPDLRSVDLGLVEDKLERILREAFTKYLLIDSKPRRMGLVVPSSLPLPLLSTTLDLIFNRFQSPIVSLVSSAAMSTVSAGLRSALVVDLGWAETVVTSVYEYREVRCTRSIRGGRLLTESLHKILRDRLDRDGAIPREEADDLDQHFVSFDECEDIIARLVWCKPSQSSSAQPGAGLPTVQEQDESEHEVSAPTRSDGSIKIPLKSTRPPTTLTVPFSQLAEACENAFFEERPNAPYSFDDEELPAQWLVYQHLLHLPVDVRAVCMSRIVFTGGCSRILGLRGRIFNDVSGLVRARGWDPVTGRGVEALKNNPKLRRNGSRQAQDGPTGVSQPDEDQDGVWHDAANADPETNAIDEQLEKGKTTPLQGQLRAVETLGAWSGASLTCQLKVMAIANVDRDAWLQNGINGASKPSDVDFKAQHRQSMGPGGLMRGAAATGERSWTLGAWGTT